MPPPPSSTAPVAVLGCGLIGESWSALFLAHGLDVVAWDPDGAVLAALPQRVERLLGQLQALGTGTAGHGRLSVVQSVAAAVGDAGWIQENAPEKTAVKHSLYAEVEAAARPDAVIASSTSSLTWSDLAAGVVRRERLVTAHPFNPPHLMPLVELFAADAQTLARAEAFYRGLGRDTVALKKDAVGHIANRLASALWREAVNIVAEGIADVADVDAALVHGPGLRWSVIGAHMAYHLGGGPGGIAHYLDHLGPSQERRWATLGSPSLTPAVRQLLVDGIADEAAGRSIAALEADRDRGLMLALAARQTAKQGEDA
ncbi:3-hydroxyacyl-CoA dehydrogenase [Azospirillum palustre]|uniref:3-hydroxyacyl-CoA dehydrogenase n=1 Tax=Azospirillum palustre TaxID=2044885 RepID=A0A2B8BC90_9PROT|nr:3-hydroxyacyl-CoA dehydrogenase NAD-binding domain-containing protein [Azospirillum palustre]PGH55531.1 3-hydroxyacyl-CoA dehydrogenase [Azospirillum palustre]